LRSLAHVIERTGFIGAIALGLAVLPAGAPASGAVASSGHAAIGSAQGVPAGLSWGHPTTLGVNRDIYRPAPAGEQTPHASGERATTLTSGNWAGLVDTGTTFTGVSAFWTVPAVRPSSSLAVSSTWIGVDGYNNADLIQAGTEQNTSGGSTSYYVWYEILPAPEVEIGGVSPGDVMDADIFQNSLGTWTISIKDDTSNQSFSSRFSYSGPRKSAEWIEEMPSVMPGPQPPLADFGTAQFNTLDFTSPGGNATSNSMVMVNANDYVSAYPSFSQNTMTVTYGRFATRTSIAASPNQVSSGTSVTYSASVTSPFGGTTTGFATFRAGPAILCTAALSNGSGSCTSTIAPIGTDTISGSYSGDNVYAPSAGSTTLMVNNPPPPPATQHGYWLAGSDGGIFSFGSAQFYGSTGNLHLQRPVVGIVPTADRGGYWLDASDGGIFSFGDSGFYGSIPGLGLHPAGSGLPNSLDAPVVGMVPSADGGGYFMVASDGGVFAFGDARFAGSCPAIGGCVGAAVAVMPDATGNGYWVVTQSGLVYAFGDAPYDGAPGPQSVPITAAVRTPDGRGYWILFANGAVSPFGDALQAGCPYGAPFGGLNPATAIFSDSDAGGYWVATANGTVVSCGDAPDDGSMSGAPLNGSIISGAGW
jgi:hypothetical protein